MGWSCRKEVSDTLDKLQRACVLSTGMQNSFVQFAVRYMFELDRTEYADGHATGEVLEFEPSPREMFAHKVGTFRITKTGKLSKSSHWTMHNLAWVMKGPQ